MGSVVGNGRGGRGADPGGPCGSVTRATLLRGVRRLSDPFEFVTFTVPARVANLGFRIAVPKDWAMPEHPAEGADFNTPTIFLPLMLAVAPYAFFR